MANRRSAWITFLAYAGLCLAGVASTTQHATAQRPWRTGVGDRVRVTTSELPGKLVGIVVSLDATTLVLKARRFRELTLSVAFVTTLERSEGRHPMNVSPGRAALLAAGGCAIAGLVTQGYEGLALVLAAVSVCPIVGAIFATVFGRERWEILPALMPLSPSGRGVMVGWSLPVGRR